MEWKGPELLLTPPVTSIVLPLANNEGFSGEIAGYVEVCQVLVSDGNGGNILRFESWTYQHGKGRYCLAKHDS